MDIKEYCGDLIGGSLLVKETKVLVDYFSVDMPFLDIKKLVEIDNILQKKSIQTSKRYLRTIYRRINATDKSFINLLSKASDSEYVQLLLIAMIIDSPIVADFMCFSLKEAHRTYKPMLPDDAWLEFYNTRMGAHLDLGRFSHATIKKMGNNVIKALVDSGYLSDCRTKKIQPVYLMSEVKDWLVCLGREDLIDVMECTI